MQKKLGNVTMLPVFSHNNELLFNENPLRPNKIMWTYDADNSSILVFKHLELFKIS